MARAILVLEDNETMREAVCAVLEQAGYKVIEAAGVPVAVNILRSQHIDLAIIDLKMPIVDGYKFCEFMRKTSKYSDIPIIIITAEEKRYGRETAEFLKLEAYMEKPFSPIDLLAKVKEILEKVGEV